MLEPRDLALWSQPPPLPRSRDANIPTILFSWWCTIFAAVIIVTRLCGRMSRSNKLFREDWIMMLALVPLFVRMGFIHVTLLYGTNNVQVAGAHLTEVELYHRSVGSRLVLAARIFYAMFIWTCKFTVSEFLKRITHRIWRRSYEWTLRGIRIFLVITFFLVVISTLTDCQPFDHYWQVIPDPGSHCRQGYSNLLTMGICDMITDILLIAFPVPIILQAGATWKRKIQLVSLFGLSIILIAVTATRIPRVIDRRGIQQYRSVWASVEILASAAVSNAVILGAFLRDKGTKRAKFKSSSALDSIERSSVRRPTLVGTSTGSDEDLFRAMGMKVPDHLHDEKSTAPRPAPVAMPARPETPTNYSHPSSSHSSSDYRSVSATSDSCDLLRKQEPSEHPTPLTKQSSAPFDVGGLLETGTPSSTPRSSIRTPVESGHDGTIAHDFAPPTPSQSRRTSSAALQDPNVHSTVISARPSSKADRWRESESHNPRQDRHSTLRPANSPIEHQSRPENANTLLAFLQESRAPPASSGSRAQTRKAGKPPLPSPSPQYELQDIGGLLTPSHHRSETTTSNPRVGVRREDQATRWEELDIQDPGGLLGS